MLVFKEEEIYVFSLNGTLLDCVQKMDWAIFGLYDWVIFGLY